MEPSPQRSRIIPSFQINKQINHSFPFPSANLWRKLRKELMDLGCPHKKSMLFSLRGFFIGFHLSLKFKEFLGWPSLKSFFFIQLFKLRLRCTRFGLSLFFDAGPNPQQKERTPAKTNIITLLELDGLWFEIRLKSWWNKNNWSWIEWIIKNNWVDNKEKISWMRCESWRSVLLACCVALSAHNQQSRN